MVETFGRSMEFPKSAANILSGLWTSSISPNNISSCIETAHLVAGCDYEYGSSWGREVSTIISSFFHKHEVEEIMDWTIQSSS